MPEPLAFMLDADLESGVVPISKAATSLAVLLKRVRQQRRPVIITQKGFPSAVLLDIEVYVALRRLAARHRGGKSGSEG
jgi:prevent-host-death family protein